MSQCIVPAASTLQGLGSHLWGCSQRRGAAALSQGRSWRWPGHKHQGLGPAELDLPHSGGEGEKGRLVLSEAGGTITARLSLALEHPCLTSTQLQMCTGDEPRP